jgi:hypothetical protein
VGEILPFVEGMADEDTGGICVSEASKNGFLEMGRSIVILDSGFRGAGEVADAGDTARFRNGLFEEKFRFRPDDGRRSKVGIKEC